MASKNVTCNIELDAEATRIAETVSAMLEGQSDSVSLDLIVSNAVRIAYEEPIKELVKAASPKPSGSSQGSYAMR